MERKKIQLEYVLNGTSEQIIWNLIGTPTGLQEWFADEVKFQEKHATFKWGKTEVREATIVSIRHGSYIRFHWLDEDIPHEYFELRIQRNELTNDYILCVTDFCESSEEDDLKELWKVQIDNLCRRNGL